MLKLKKIYASILILFISGFSFSQTKVTGLILDSLSTEKLPYAAIRLTDANDSIITACITDTTGYFKLETKSSEYKYLKINFLGYNEIVVELDKSKNQNLGEIKLGRNENELSVINIEGFNSNVEHFANRTEITFDSINVANSKTIYQLLKFIPSTMVIEDKNIIKYHGNSKVLILVNGIERQEEFIKSIKPEEIVKVEIVKNSLEFTDEAYIIFNIIMTEEIKQGLNIDILLDAETTYKNNTSSLNFRYGYQNIEFYINYDFDSENFIKLKTVDRQIETQSGLFYYDTEENIFDKNKYIKNSINSGINLYLKNQITIYLTSSVNFTGTQTNTFSRQIYNFENELPEIHRFYMLPDNSRDNHNFSASIKKIVDNHTFSIVSNYYVLEDINIINAIDSIEYVNITLPNYVNNQNSYYYRNSIKIKANYDYNFNSKIFLKNSYTFYTTNVNSTFTSQNDEVNLKTHDYVNSWYSSISGTSLGVDYNLGFKFQNNRYNLNDSLINKNYIIPAIGLSKSLNENNYLDFNCSVMQMYIYYLDLLEAKFYTDSLNYSTGNVNLLDLPRLMYMSGLTYSYNNQFFNFSSSIYSSFLKNSIYPFYEPIDNVLTQRKTDLKNEYSLSYNFSLTLIFFEKLYFSQYHYFTLSGNKDSNYHFQGKNYSLYLILDYYFKNGLSAGSEFSFSTKYYNIQGYSEYSPYLKFYLSKNIFNDKGSLYLGIVPFNSKSLNYCENFSFSNSEKSIIKEQRIYLEFRYNLFKGKELISDKIENIEDSN